MGNLVRDGIFTKPFWHITSDIFIPSIKKYGLGGVNPIATYELIDVFRTLVGLGNRELEFDENWKKHKPLLEEIAEQTRSNDSHNYNFSHGESYITLNKEIALRYREINGCEMLFYLETARRLLEHIGLARQCLELIPGRVQRLLDKKREPVLLKIRNVPVKFVGTENGEDIFSLIDLYDRYFREGVISGNPQNFRLTTPVKWEDISVEEMVPHC